ncbi:MAG: hypothetical protein KAT83_02375 [Candidatus Aenigmarchaeota archaeon]|nr:hypothetical protein [Candidatus Aenigmarchaeota archaeon]
MVAGWNLIGYWGTEGLLSYDSLSIAERAAACELYSLGTSIWDTLFTSLWTYWEPDDPNQWISLGLESGMDPGAGYWVMAVADGIFAPPTVC